MLINKFPIGFEDLYAVTNVCLNELYNTQEEEVSNHICKMLTNMYKQ